MHPQKNLTHRLGKTLCCTTFRPAVPFDGKQVQEHTIQLLQVMIVIKKQTHIIYIYIYNCFLQMHVLTTHHKLPSNPAEKKHSGLESWLDFPLENCRTFGSSAAQQTRATSRAQVMPPKKPKTSARPDGTTGGPKQLEFGGESTHLVYH